MTVLGIFTTRVGVRVRMCGKTKRIVQKDKCQRRNNPRVTDSSFLVQSQFYFLCKCCFFTWTYEPEKICPNENISQSGKRAENKRKYLKSGFVSGRHETCLYPFWTLILTLLKIFAPAFIFFLVWTEKNLRELNWKITSSQQRQQPLRSTSDYDVLSHATAILGVWSRPPSVSFYVCVKAKNKMQFCLLY